MKFDRSYIPFFAASIVVGGIVSASGGSGFQTIVAAIATGTSGYTTSTLMLQSQTTRQRAIEQERDRLQQEMNRHQREIEQECDRFQQEMNRLQQEMNRALPLGANLEYLQRKQTLLQKDIQTLEEKKETLEARVRQIQQDPPNLETLEQQQQALGKLKALIQEHSGQLQGIQDQITEREAQRDRLQDVTSEFLQKQREVEELRQRIQDLNQQATELELFRVTYDALQRDESRLKTQKEQLDADVRCLEGERDRILSAIGRMEAQAQEVDRLRIILEGLIQEIRDKQSHIKSLNRQINSLESEKNNLQDEIAGLEAKLKRLRDEIRQAKEDLKEAKEEAQENIEQAFKALNKPIEVKVQKRRNFGSEGEFLDTFKQYLGAKGLVFPDRVIQAFHTSLKVQDISALVILAGISGTGKSELPQAYAEFIGAPLVMLPVQPRWDSPQDLQGFYNYLEKKYKPTLLMHYLYQHERQSNLKGRMVLVMLDEMNLARVEYYFSDFLSKLETRRNDETYLELDAGSLSLTEDQKKVRIAEEFLFIGTMNEDETTQTLSDKVLDRANVLTFGRPPELKLRGQHHKPPVPSEYLPWETFQSWTKDPSLNPHLTEKVKSFVDRANDIMEPLGRPFAHRVFQSFAKYVANYPRADQDDTVLNQAIADQFGQKLLPKLRGVMVEETEGKTALDRMQTLLSELGDEALNEAFKKARQGQYGQFQWKGMIYRQD